MITTFRFLIDRFNRRFAFLVISLLFMSFLIGCATTTIPEVDSEIAVNNSSASEPEQPTATAGQTPSPVTESTATPTTVATATAVPPTDTPSTSSVAADAPTPTTPVDESLAVVGDPVLGLEIFKGQFCGICHQLGAAETAGVFGPPHDEIGSIAAQRIQAPDYNGAATTAAEYLRESIVNPQIYLVDGFEYSRHPMPAYTHLTEVEVEALVQFLLEQK